MKRILVTGANGFVGKYMIACLKEMNFEVVASVRTKSDAADELEMDLLNNENTKKIIKNIQPNFIIHLAGQSSVSLSWKEKEETINNNVLGTLHLLDAVLESKIACRILNIGSSEEYGFVYPTESPINEANLPRPMSPYGISKLTAGLLSLQYAKAYQMDIIHTRTFNHVGPGQSLGFVTQDFAKQISDIEKKLVEPIITVGNLDSIRDFTDVRDIVKAYVMLMLKGKSGEVYNICSGHGIKIRDILNQLLEMSNMEIQIKNDPNKIRPSDVPILIGNNNKLISETSWKPLISIRTSLLDILNWYREL